MSTLIVALVLSLNGQPYTVQSWHPADGETLRAAKRACDKQAINIRAQGVEVECRVTLQEQSK